MRRIDAAQETIDLAQMDLDGNSEFDWNEERVALTLSDEGVAAAVGRDASYRTTSLIR